MRIIDDKFHIEGDQIIKTSSGEIIPEDEPLLLFRARDYLALPLIEHYKKLCVIDGCNDYQLEGINKCIQRFEQFAKENPNKMKQPGVTRGLPYIPQEE